MLGFSECLKGRGGTVTGGKRDELVAELLNDINNQWKQLVSDSLCRLVWPLLPRPDCVPLLRCAIILLWWFINFKPDLVLYGYEKL